MKKRHRVVVLSSLLLVVVMLLRARELASVQATYGDRTEVANLPRDLRGWSLWSLYQRIWPPAGERDKVWVHVCVRTYTAQNLQVLGTISSLFSASQASEDWLRLSIAVLNTGQDGTLLGHHHHQHRIIAPLPAPTSSRGSPGTASANSASAQYSTLSAAAPHAHTPQATLGTQLFRRRSRL